jgi:hypothetical protein
VFGWAVCNTFRLQRNLITLKHVWLDGLGNQIPTYSPSKHSLPHHNRFHYPASLSRRLLLIIQDLQSCGVEEEEEQEVFRRLRDKVNPSLSCLFTSASRGSFSSAR